MPWYNEHRDSIDLLFSKSAGNKAVSDFVEQALLFLMQNGLHIDVIDVDQLPDEGAGEFSAVPKMLTIAVGCPLSEWVPVLLHELNHAKQFVENPALFLELDKGCDEFFRWSAGEEIEGLDPKRALMKCLFVESDCERRTVDSIEMYNLQDVINKEDYAQQANAYVTFYAHVFKKRKWNAPGKGPWQHSSMYSLFPTQVQLFGCSYEQYAKLFAKCMR